MTPEEHKLLKQDAEQVSEKLKKKAKQARDNKSQLEDSYKRYQEKGGVEVHEFYHPSRNSQQ